jgi:signal transduction histidine kinase/ActR/RegA family two-component response regulator
MFQLYGISPTSNASMNQVIYEVWANAVHPEDFGYTETSLNQAVLGQGKFDPEFRIIQPDGKIRHIKAHAELLRDIQGNPQRMIGVNIDISDRKQAEALLQRTNQELISATRLKDEFLANMSHELRTPLNAILGMTEALIEKVFGEINQQQQQFLEIIDRSANHLLSLINDILDLAKIESGQIKVERQPVTIATLCQSSLAFIKQPAYKKRIQLQTKIPENLPLLYADERRIRQVLINLLNNAVKFTPEGGKITLEVSQLSDTDNLSYIRLAVIDTGIGISPDNIKKLFQPFFQIDSALNRQYEGTGLGLPLVKNIVDLHDGKVSIISKEGEGSTFMIDLPCIPFEVTSSSGNITNITSDYIEDQEELVTTAPLILLVEDNEANVIAVSSYLTAKGYRLIYAKNGQEAITMTELEHPDLVIMDIQMPGMDGLEATRYIRNQLQLARLPIIALTALAMEGDREKCLAAGANEYLSKPVKLKSLVEIMQNLIKNE